MVQSLLIRDNGRVGSDIAKDSRDMIDQDARGDAPQEEARDRHQIIREFSEVLDRNSRLLIQVTTRELAERYGLSLLQAHALETLWRGEPEMEMSAFFSVGVFSMPKISWPVRTRLAPNMRDA